VSDDAYALIMALSALAAAAALWHRIQEGRSVKRLQRLLEEQRIQNESADPATRNDPPRE
jgi:hypothetical protein